MDPVPVPESSQAGGEIGKCRNNDGVKYWCGETMERQRSIQGEGCGFH